MTGIMRGIGLLAAAVLLTGCGDGDAEPQPDGQASSAASSAPAVSMTMREVCPEVEAALPSADGLLPASDDVLTFEQRLNELREAGDTETVNALDLLDPATAAVLEAEEAGGSAVLDARAAWRDGIGAFADRCAAAGSSALQ